MPRRRLLLVPLLALAGCSTTLSWLSEHTVEWRHLHSACVQVEALEPRPVLHLTAANMDSALVFRPMRQQRRGDTLDLTVVQKLAVEGQRLRGDFDFRVEVPDGVNTVRFGKERAVLWTRSPPDQP
ncbi:MAG: hypothetical protein QM767_21050 [Anaeromyxobacter sp.]